MNVDVVSESAAQALFIRVAMEALGAIVAVLFCLAFAAFVLYLVGVWRLCQAEHRLSE